MCSISLADAGNAVFHPRQLMYPLPPRVQVQTVALFVAHYAKSSSERGPARSLDSVLKEHRFHHTSDFAGRIVGV